MFFFPTFALWPLPFRTTILFPPGMFLHGADWGGKGFLKEEDSLGVWYLPLLKWAPANVWELLPAYPILL